MGPGACVPATPPAASVPRQVLEWMRRWELEGATCVLMAAGAAWAPRLLAAFAITDPLKPEAPAVVAALRWTLRVGSGWRPAAVTAGKPRGFPAPSRAFFTRFAPQHPPDDCPRSCSRNPCPCRSEQGPQAELPHGDG